jgi:hypothetical protein
VPYAFTSFVREPTYGQKYRSLGIPLKYEHKFSKNLFCKVSALSWEFHILSKITNESFDIRSTGAIVQRKVS